MGNAFDIDEQQRQFYWKFNDEKWKRVAAERHAEIEVLPLATNEQIRGKDPQACINNYRVFLQTWKL